MPSDTEWTELVNYLGGEDIAGGRMKEMSTAHWESPNTGANNISGFTALPGGYRGNINGSFLSVGYYGIWWDSTEDSSSNAYNCYLYNDNAGGAYRGSKSKAFGLSVRCVKN